MNTINRTKLYRDAWKDFKQHWHTFLLIFLTFVLVNFLAGFGGDGMEVAATIISWFAGTWLGIGYLNYLLNIVDGEKAMYRDIFHGVKSVEQFAYYVIVGLVYSALVLIGSIFLIVPGIILALGLMFATYYIAENRLGLRHAFKSSWEITHGHKWGMFKLAVFLTFFNIGGLLALGVGLLITIPMTHLIFARLFRQLEGIPLPDAGNESTSEDDEEEVVEVAEVVEKEEVAEEEKEA